MKQSPIHLLVGLFFILVVVGNSSAQWDHKGYGWPMFGQDISHSRYNPQFSKVPLGEIKLLGEYETGGEIISSPSLGDLNGDGIAEIVFGSEDQHIYALGVGGGSSWKYKTNGPVTSSPAIGNLDGSGTKVVIGSGDGNLYVLNSDGKLDWKYQTAGRITSSPTLADLDGDGKKEIIFGSWDKSLYVLNSRGKKITSFATQEVVESSPAVGDVNADGRVDIIFGSNDNKIYIISPPVNGQALSRIGVYLTSGDVSSSPSLAELNGDNFPEILVGSTDGIFYCLSFQEIDRKEEKRFNNGEWVTTWETIKTRIAKIWDYETSGEIIASPAVADIDGDGNQEIIIGSKDKHLYFFDFNGELLHKYTLNDRIVSSPSLADFDGDGKLEVVIASADGRIYILNSDAFRVWENHLPGKVSSSPSIADLDGDGSLEFVIGSWNKKLYVFGKGAIENPPEASTTATTLPANHEIQPDGEEDSEKESTAPKVIGWPSISFAGGSLITGLLVFLIILFLSYFTYKKGTCNGALEVTKSEEELIDSVLTERSKVKPES